MYAFFENNPVEEEPAADSTVNVALRLKTMARIQPYRRAVVYPSGRDPNGRVAYSHLTFRQLERESDCFARGLEAAGIVRGTRTILMVRPSLELFALTYAMLKVGAVFVMVDPGMGVRRMLTCLRKAAPRRLSVCRPPMSCAPSAPNTSRVSKQPSRSGAAGSGAA
jgi:olefin beta-lactone synthetase